MIRGRKIPGVIGMRSWEIGWRGIIQDGVSAEKKGDQDKSRKKYRQRKSPITIILVQDKVFTARHRGHGGRKDKGGEWDIFVCRGDTDRQKASASARRDSAQTRFETEIGQKTVFTTEAQGSQCGVAATKSEAQNPCLRRSGYAQAGET